MSAAKKKRKARPAQPDHSRQQALECIPVKNPQVWEEIDADGDLRLLYQVQVRPWFHRIMKKITGREKSVIDRTLQLDQLGASVWQMIDGRKSVRKIIDEFQDQQQLNRREAEISVSAFFKELGRRGLLAMREQQ